MRNNTEKTIMAAERSSELALAALLRGAGEFAVCAGQTSWAAILEHRLSAALRASVPGATIKRALDVAKDSCNTPRDTGGELLAYSWRLAGGERPVSTPLTGRVWSPLAAVFDRPKNAADAELPLVPLGQYLAGAATSGASTTFPGLFEQFAAAISAVPATDISALIQSLLTALETFGWCVPATGYDDVSIFELARSAAAIAAAVAAQRDKQPPSGLANINLMLAVGDLGGIQRFLYAVVTSKAARMLRGRSLGLQLIADAIAARILERFALPITNLIYSGGGKVWLLMPAAAQAELLRLGEQIDLELNRQFASRLSFGLGCAVISASDLVTGVSELWNRAIRNLAQWRRRRFSQLIRGSYEQLFEPFGEGSEACHVCGELSPDLQPLSREHDERTRLACGQCREFVELGSAATRARVVIRRTAGGVTGEAKGRYRVGEYEYLLYDEAAAARVERTGCTLMWIDSPPLRWDSRCGQSMWLAGLNLAVTNQGGPLDFDELANNSEGIDRLGILRMDVDSLGRIFSEGLSGSANFARIAALSRHLSYFFGAYLSHLVAACRDRVQIIYSGGDDLFAVGAWSEIPLVAQRIRDGFTRFTGANPNWGISAGIEIMPPAFPIAAAAQLAGEAEERAKNFKRPRGGKSKDAVCFLDEVLGWEDFAALTQARDQLYQLFGGAQPRLSRATLRTLHLIACEARASGLFDEQFRVDDATQAVRRGKWAWQAAYAVARAAGSPQDREQLYQLYRSLSNHQWNGIKQPLRLLKPAAEWIDLLKRERNK